MAFAETPSTLCYQDVNASAPIRTSDAGNALIVAARIEFRQLPVFHNLLDILRHTSSPDSQSTLRCVESRSSGRLVVQSDLSNCFFFGLNFGRTVRLSLAKMDLVQI